MFKFDFLSDSNADNGKVEDSIDWLKCSEVTLERIQEVTHRNDNNTTIGIFATGSMKIKHIPASEAMKRALSCGSGNISKAEENHSDLVPGQYEGGLKVWECTKDLADLITTNAEIDWTNKTVLDLGCGAGFLGLIVLLQGATVVFHDYNPEVLEFFTGPNVLLNLEDVSADKVEFYSGDWLAFLDYFQKKRPGDKFDYILSSETIYNPANNEKLHNVLSNLLAPNGVCYLAGKCIYFGVGGSMRGFEEHINAKGALEAETCWSTSEGVAREIFKIKHKVSS